ncbi:MAG TPA: ribonuclease H [Acidimicrobiia bacterium]|jgi:ribonuclease HI
MGDFVCVDCGAAFSVPQSVLERYPGWTPRLCRACRDAKAPARATAQQAVRGGGTRRGSGTAALLSTAQVLERYQGGPSDGVFTDGGAVPNPGPGGWGAVYVRAGAVVDEASGHEPDTTNNRMELTALIEGAAMVPDGTPAVVYSDSRLAVDTLTKWASGWEQRGWRRKTGPVENLDLVKRAYYTFRRRPELRLEWIAAHSGHRWNEYADALASKWRLGTG